MEKLDYLRWYIGDTRIRNSKGYLTVSYTHLTLPTNREV